METVNVTLPVPKETKEVIDCLAAIYEFVQAKKPFVQIGELFDELSAAVDGAAGLSAEMKSQYRDEAAGYLVHILLEKMMPVKPEVPEVAAPNAPA